VKVKATSNFFIWQAGLVHLPGWGKHLIYAGGVKIRKMRWKSKRESLVSSQQSAVSSQQEEEASK
jgi:hypothetical protein